MTTKASSSKIGAFTTYSFITSLITFYFTIKWYKMVYFTSLITTQIIDDEI